MSVNIRPIWDEVATHIASGVAGITLYGTSAGGIWPSPMRVADDAIPKGQLAVFPIGSSSPVRYADGTGFTNQRMAGFGRLIARSPAPMDGATPYGLIRDAMEFGHDNPPSGYSDFRFTTSTPLWSPIGDRSIPVYYADFQWAYFG